MRVPRTLYLYVSREILAYGGIAFLAITGVLVGQNLLRRLEDLLVVGFDAGDLSTVAMMLLGMLVAYATPIAFLFGVALATSRLSADSEVLAMRANGLGLRPLLAPALVLGLAITLVTGYLMMRVEPQAQRSLRTMLKSIAARGGVLEPGKFRDVLGRVIFVEARDADNRLEGVVISDRTNAERPFIIFAEHGQFHFDERAEVIRFSLRNGDVHIEPKGLADEELAEDRYRRIAFREFDYEVDVSSIVSGASTQFRPREMSNGELRDSLLRLRAGEKMVNLREQDPVEYELQLHRRFALPIAPLLFAMIAVPLSLRGAQSARSWGAMQSVTLVFGYYALLSFAQYLAREGWMSAATALWAPNAVLLVGAFVLLVRAGRRVAS